MMKAGIAVREGRNEQGFTLIELLIAVVLVGVLSAVAIVGISGVTSSGNKSSCSTLLSAAQSAATTYYANAGYYPKTSSTTPAGFDELMTSSSRSPAVLSLPSSVNHSGTVISTSSWSITMQGGGSNTPNTYVKTGTGSAPCS